MIATASSSISLSPPHQARHSAEGKSQDAARVRLRALLRAQPRGTFLQHHQALSRHRNPLRKDCQKLPRRRPPRLRPGLAQMTTGPSTRPLRYRGRGPLGAPAISWRNCPKRVGGACGVALRSTETVLFGPFWPPFTSQIHAQSVVRTPFRTVSEWGFSEVGQEFIGNSSPLASVCALVNFRRGFSHPAL